MSEMTDAQARRLIEWVTDHGHTVEEAREALAYVMGADKAGKEKGSQTAGKQN